MMNEKSLNFIQIVLNGKQHASSFALYLVAPSHLDPETLNHFRKEFKQTPYGSVEYVLAQKGMEGLNTYMLTIYNVRNKK